MQRSSGVRTVSIASVEYPAPLRTIPNAPQTLYARGSWADWADAVAVVGARDPDERGVALAAKVVRILAMLLPNLVVVAGLAPGIDTQAHRTALECGVQTVAVTGSGLDLVSNEVADAILNGGGAIFSELPNATRENQERRLARDRIQSGLSIATVVVQSHTVGGSMETAYTCLSQGRLLCAIRPPSAGAPGWEGNEFLTSTFPEEIETGPPRLRRFKRFAVAGASLAVPVDPTRLVADLAVIRDRAS